MATIPQNRELLKHLLALLGAHRVAFKQERVYQRVVALALSEVFTFARHTVTQLLLSLGLAEQEWSAWYRLLSRGRFQAEQVSTVLLSETLVHVAPDAVYVIAGDGTQTARSSGKMEGTGWLRNPRTPPFRVGIHMAQRWFHGAWLLPAENGYSRALPLRWLPAFTTKARLAAHQPCAEWAAAATFVGWVRRQLDSAGRTAQPMLMVADGQYDNLKLWDALPERVTLLVRSAKNRVLRELPAPASGGRGRPCRYGPRAPTPQQLWQERRGWHALTLLVRGRLRHLQVKVRGPYLRQGAAACPLMLILVRGKNNAHTRREPLPFLVNAVRDDAGQWGLPLPLETLLFWAWQRWEVEVAHRELKSNFGLGHKQCWNPIAAVAAVQWSAWVYGLLLLAGYRTWGLTHAPPVPTRWWRGAPRWSLNTLWRAYRAALWGSHEFRPLWTATTSDWAEKEAWLLALRHAAFASARA